jgi:acetoin utilization deacetylase AcuC-like enzyme
MLTVYSEHHLKHQPQLEFFEGDLKRFNDTAERALIILYAVNAADLGPVVAADDFGLSPILAVHTTEYVSYLQNAYDNWIADGGIARGVYPDTFPVRHMEHRPTRPAGLAGYYCMDLTAIIVAGTWEAAYHSAQCALTAARQVHTGERAAFALCRPPGHHAHADLCGGYCFLNNAAIATQWLVKAFGASQPGRDSTDACVALLDIDFHHGNGSQSIFYHRRDVLFVSVHADPDRQYPYFLGSADETGAGQGLGFTANYPLEKGIGDAQYLEVLTQACVRIQQYAPRVLVVSLGVDTYGHDPLGDFALSADAFPHIGAIIAQLNLPTVFIMEGGYAIQQLGRNVVGVLEGFESKK